MDFCNGINQTSLNFNNQSMSSLMYDTQGRTVNNGHISSGKFQQDFEEGHQENQNSSSQENGKSTKEMSRYNSRSELAYQRSMGRLIDKHSTEISVRVQKAHNMCLGGETNSLNTDLSGNMNSHAVSSNKITNTTIQAQSVDSIDSGQGLVCNYNSANLKTEQNLNNRQVTKTQSHIDFNKNYNIPQSKYSINDTKQTSVTIQSIYSGEPSTQSVNYIHDRNCSLQQASSKPKFYLPLQTLSVKQQVDPDANNHSVFNQKYANLNSEEDSLYEEGESEIGQDNQYQDSSHNYGEDQKDELYQTECNELGFNFDRSFIFKKKQDLGLHCQSIELNNNTDFEKNTTTNMNHNRAIDRSQVVGEFKENLQENIQTKMFNKSRSNMENQIGRKVDFQ